jgi:hypothetical protein
MHACVRVSVRIVLVLFARLIDMLDLAHLKLADTIGEGVTLSWPTSEAHIQLTE